MAAANSPLGQVEEMAQNGAPEPQLSKALYQLGLDYATGHGVEKDLIEAHKWLNLAAVHGYSEAAVDRDELARELDRRDIRRALKRAREWHATH
ncbi:MAG: SEL1-like repeat protein [Kordiimonadaceae bacterium]|nr:SEL1-like repeat protein [Kordiimonadaceae bacterium]MBO6569896.1 SEL1-like repeat protein [Kordiimonadaceae bacterium]MBO6966008.1 SEL1-like repeat protein [Kordiimonadaceae bacterium]